MTDQLGGTDPHVMEPGTAPTPFTAGEIRDRSQAGKAIRVLVEVAGQEPLLRQNRYVDLDESGATLERSQHALDGTPIGEPESVRVTWLDLQAHASFPAAATTIEPDRVETPMGELDCLRYTVRDGSDVRVFWFAPVMPGMPVRFEHRTDGQVVMTTTMVHNSDY